MVNCLKNKQIKGEFKANGEAYGTAKLKYCFNIDQTYDAVYEGNFGGYINLEGYGKLTIE